MQDVFAPARFIPNGSGTKGKPEDFPRPPGDPSLVAERRQVLSTTGTASCCPRANRCSWVQRTTRGMGHHSIATSKPRLGQAIASDYLLLKPDEMPNPTRGLCLFPPRRGRLRKSRPPPGLRRCPHAQRDLSEKARSFLTQPSPAGLAPHQLGPDRHRLTNIPHSTFRVNRRKPASFGFDRAKPHRPPRTAVSSSHPLETYPLPTLEANPPRAPDSSDPQTMPPEIAQYKNLTPARGNLLDYLQGATSAGF